MWISWSNTTSFLLINFFVQAVCKALLHFAHNIFVHYYCTPNGIGSMNVLLLNYIYPNLLFNLVFSFFKWLLIIRILMHTSLAGSTLLIRRFYSIGGPELHHNWKNEKQIIIWRFNVRAIGSIQKNFLDKLSLFRIILRQMEIYSLNRIMNISQFNHMVPKFSVLSCLQFPQIVVSY